MGFFGDFFGSSQRKDLTNSYNQSNGYLTSGYNQAQGNYQNASNLYAPYAQQGRQATDMYNNALGINGVQAQKDFGANYAASDPFRQFNQDQATNAIMRSYNARGMGGGGTAALATSRANLERGSQDYNNYLNRLQGVGQQGYGATQAQAGIQTGMGDLAYGYGQQRAGNAIQYGNAMAQSRSTGINNILGMLGTGASAIGAWNKIPNTGGGGPVYSAPGTAANGGWATQAWGV